jgi:acyl-CoA dehydrogenase
MSYGRLEIRDAFAAYLRDALPLERCRQIAEREGGFSPALWRELAAGGWLELGSPEMAVPFAEVASVSEAVGARRLPGPLSLTSTVVTPLLAGWLPELAADVASGAAVVVPIMPRLGVQDGSFAVEPLRVADVGDGLELTDTVRGVAYAGVATHLLVPIEDDEGSVGLAVVALPAPGVSLDPEAVIDLTTPSPSVRLGGVVVSSADVRRGDSVRAELAAAVLRYLHAETAEAVGGIGEVIARTRAYVSERVQFGVPVGSFQALKHALADVQVSYELGRGLLFELAEAVDEGAEDQAVEVLAARAFAGEAYVRACETAIQCHGGAGFTWEQGLHYWYRAALRLRATPFPVLDLRRVAAALVGSHLGIDPQAPSIPQVTRGVER